MMELLYALFLLAAVGLLGVQAKEIADQGSIWPEYDDNENEK